MLQDQAIKQAIAEERIADAFEQGKEDILQTREPTQFYRDDAEWEAWEIGQRWGELILGVRNAHTPMEDREDY